MNRTNKTCRVLVAKPGLDGHDVGAKIIARALMDAGFDVIYTGLRQSPEQIVQRVRDDSVDVLALSILSGSHIPICRRLKGLLEETGMTHILWVVGGSIPQRDHPALRELGVQGIFAAGASTDSVVQFIRRRAS